MAKFSKGLLIGGIIGGFAGLWNAPYKGSETRKYIKEYIETIQSDSQAVQHNVDNMRIILKRVTTELLPQAENTMNAVQTEVRQFTETMQPRIRRIQQQLGTIQQNIEENTKK